MATKKAKAPKRVKLATRIVPAAVVPRIVALDRDFNEIEGGTIASGNIRVVLATGSLDLYVADGDPESLTVVTVYEGIGVPVSSLMIAPDDRDSVILKLLKVSRR